MSDVSRTVPAGGARPSMLSLNIKEKSALYAAFMPHLKNGGIFIPTVKAYRLGDPVYMLLSLMDDPAKLPVAGTVAWITPQGAHGNKQQGIGVQFSADDSGQAARRKIENLLGNALTSTRPTHTL
jgi:type IV pilus assembly protein PilZ